MSQFVEQPIYNELSRIGKALANPVRLRLLDLLDVDELTVEQVAELAGLPVKNTSAQLQQLRAVQLVSSRRDGQRIYYRISGTQVSEFLGRFHEFAENTLADLRSEIQKYLGTADQLAPVTATQLGEMIDDKSVTVLDVRPTPDYMREHVPGAVSMPLTTFTEQLDDLPHRRQIVAYCQGPYCISSPAVVRELTAAGHQARILAGGWTAWVRSGQSRESAPTATKSR